ncbi:MAG: hypothetical protein RLZZ453_111 [Chlamydiota bacterium]|jgi:hypothetical protein
MGVSMRKNWLFAMLSPVMAFSGCHEDQESCAHHEYVVVERLGVCAECGSVLGTVVDKREVAAKDESKQVSPKRKSSAYAKARALREKASSRPKVVQRSSVKEQEEIAEEESDIKERYASTTIGSLTRGGKIKADPSKKRRPVSIKKKEEKKSS